MQRHPTVQDRDAAPAGSLLRLRMWRAGLRRAQREMASQVHPNPICAYATKWSPLGLGLLLDCLL